MQKTEKKWITPRNSGKYASQQLINVRKTHRNDPCPCGALKADGKPKKFKNCHLTEY